MFGVNVGGSSEGAGAGVGGGGSEGARCHGVELESRSNLPLSNKGSQDNCRRKKPSHAICEN